ncbi:hypothetical protein [Bradyrhizobium roseum]|uniref:hypothetical protein n=1 Tax=Bradyrhizobium roseum TaxID=3056648 RepID=UPI0026249B4F|nr:hypothetical protein [Bradyrhizobium roseus]WKA30612.1 hypothetical protein QUH67_10780 [Bradyrhizobium roseus]
MCPKDRSSNPDMATDSANQSPLSASGPSTHPFRFLRIDPGATSWEIEAALTLARQRGLAPETTLAEAHASLLDPVRRLPCELAYPFGSTPEHVDLFYAELPASASDEEISQTSEQFAPLPMANFIARYAARRGASGELLLALIDAHTCIDAAEIQQSLQLLRRRASWPPLPVASVEQGLDDLLHAHCVAVIDAYDPVESAAEPLAGATRAILATRDPPLIRTLGVLLAAYRRAVEEMRSRAEQQVDQACQTMDQRPTDATSIEGLAAALQRWASLCQPMLLLDAHQGSSPPEMNVVPDRVFGLLGALINQRQYLAVQQVLDPALDAFQSIPDTSARLTKIGEIVRKIQRDASTEVDPNPHLTASAGSRGFRHLKKATAAAAALLAVLGLLGAYWTFGPKAASFVASASNPPQANAEPELLPPAGNGQRFTREYVRYCHFQEERLRVVKQRVRAPEDVRAYNALATDYNSRCANFFYQDEDLRLVKEEVIAKRKLLEADAERILSTWPWRKDAAAAPPTSK